jgi:hypothetical protein
MQPGAVCDSTGASVIASHLIELARRHSMKLLSWNLNHRAARRRIPSWIATAIDEQAPDVLVLTEYVEGPDHDFFLATLNAYLQS